jgi:hypothetical protein
MRTYIPNIKLRKEIIQKSKGRCQKCGKKGILSKRFGKPAVLEPIRKGVEINISITVSYNGKDVIPFEFDHIVPFCRGGETTLENMALLCRKCNRSKKDKSV